MTHTKGETNVVNCKTTSSDPTQATGVPKGRKERGLAMTEEKS